MGWRRVFSITSSNRNRRCCKCCRKIRTTIENYENSDIPRKITASFGVTKLQKDDDENSVIQKADEALYIAKNKGKNLVVSN